ncbi:hypothetical protein E2562_003784 [Oryza meyeriana var. granulata]|uniref:Uncharacterized protein n=1 Tax=Oryza meyeriana var. granulata TaxID=110450 RepID=A0A6G1BS98_9ORYZ|nr:hypothetical protein E2562_003784 [Oryza meyeriana var. granulata]
MVTPHPADLPDCPATGGSPVGGDGEVERIEKVRRVPVQVEEDAHVCLHWSSGVNQGYNFGFIQKVVGFTY